MEKIQLPEKLMSRAVILLEDRIPSFQLVRLRKQVAEDPEMLSRVDMGLGITVRNILRTSGLHDSRTPSGTWDDYWKDVVIELLKEK